MLYDNALYSSSISKQEIASKLISKNIDKDENGNIIHPYDSNFRSLNLESMDPISRETKEFNALVEYARNTHGATHNSFSVNVVNAFRVGRFVHAKFSLSCIDLQCPPTGQERRINGQTRASTTCQKGNDYSFGTARGLRTLLVSGIGRFEVMFQFSVSTTHILQVFLVKG